MKLILSLVLFCTSMSKTLPVCCQNPKDRIFVLEKTMIQNFDSLSFEIKLTDKAKLELSAVDFSKYSFLWIENSTTMILIFDWRTQVRPSDVLTYRNDANSIVNEDGKIRVIVSHLIQSDVRVIQLRNYLKE